MNFSYIGVVCNCHRAKGSDMRQLTTAIAAAALVATAALAVPTQAEARRGGAFAAGIIGGLAAGAIIGGAGGYAYPYGYSYGYYPTYPAPVYLPAPAYYGPPPGCVIRRQRVWDGYAWQIRRIRVCH